MQTEEETPAVRLKDRTGKRKWVVFGGCFVAYASYALFRRTVTYSMPSLISELKLTKSQLGVITSAWSLSYGLTKFWGGVLADRVSPKALLALGLSLTGVVTGLFGGYSSVSIFTALWFAQGCAQGFGWPAVMQLIRNWCSPDQVATWWSALSAAGNLGLFLAPFILTTWIHLYGWRYSFFLSGIVCLFLAAGIFFVLKDQPHAVEYSEKSQRNESETPKKTETERADWRVLLGNSFLWMLSVAYFLVLFTKLALVEWSLLYLMQKKNYVDSTAGAVVSSLEMGGLCGSFFSGVISDRIVAWMCNPTTEQKGPHVALSRLPLTAFLAVWALFSIAALEFLITPQSSPFYATVLVFSSGCSLYGIICLIGVMSLESAPPSLSGTSHAIVGLAGQVGGLFAGYPLSLVATAYDWTGVMVLLIIAVGLLFVLLIFGRALSFGDCLKKNS